ncbi:hypothetical protein KM043_002252 [Ampulex compressa]|nr:hypothetical protein KM043_002252 [Ampulex compressa]
MWLPLMLLALMASGSACPELCECRQIAARRAALSEVTCHGGVPALPEVPADTRRLWLAGAEEFEVLRLLEELETSLGEFEGNGTANESLSDRDGLHNLEELAVTNCSLVALNVSWRGLERVRALNLSCNSLAWLESALPARIAGLSELDLSENAFTDVSAGSFRTLGGLVKLSLRRNAIVNVHEEGFRGLGNLEYLDLADNRLADLPDSALTPLYSLQKLDLSGNQLQVLGARWFESLDRLRELDVSRNGLARAATGTLQPLPGLSVLKLSENPLKERDVSLLLGTGRRLETVDASRTGLARVPAALTRSVRALRLAGNKLTTIRSGDLDSYPLLRILDISDNRLVDIEDDALGRLEVLEELDISGNLLERIPGSLPSSLTVLRLQGNAITCLKPEDLQGLCNLRSLTLNDNDIGQIELDSLGQLPVLVELDISDNPIKALPANTLSGPSNLAVLRMSGLTSLRSQREEQSDMAFPVPTPERLVTLDVSRSPLLARQLLADDAALSACKSLVDLDLSETNLKSLRSDLFYMLPQLRLLGLAGNEWNCTEDLYWLGEWIRQHHESREGRCEAPQSLAGTLLRELPSPPLTATTWQSELLSSSLEDGKVANLTANPTERSEVYPLDDKTGNRTLDADGSDGMDSDRITSRLLSESTRGTVRIYEAPTSFKNVTSSVPGRAMDKAEEASGSADKNSSGEPSRASNKPVIKYEELERRSFDNRVDGRKQKGGRLYKLAVSPGKIGPSKPSKLAPRGEEARQEKHSTRDTPKEDSRTITEKTGLEKGSSEAEEPKATMEKNRAKEYSTREGDRTRENSELGGNSRTRAERNKPKEYPAKDSSRESIGVGVNSSSIAQRSGPKEYSMRTSDAARENSRIETDSRVAPESKRPLKHSSRGGEPAKDGSRNAIWERNKVREHSAKASVLTSANSSVDSIAESKRPKEYPGNGRKNSEGTNTITESKRPKEYSTSASDLMKAASKNTVIERHGVSEQTTSNDNLKNSVDSGITRAKEHPVKTTEPSSTNSSTTSERTKPKSPKSSRNSSTTSDPTSQLSRPKEYSSRSSENSSLNHNATSESTRSKLHSPRSSENSSLDSNTIAEELNGRATDSGARVSEALSAGAHPGMLVLAGAALGAVAALTVILSRRATVRRRDRYHRHENIEVHTLTPTTELW